MVYKHIGKGERLELSLLLSKGYSLRAIAKVFGRSHGSLSRELQKNKVNRSYDPQKANTKAQIRRQKSKYQGMKVRETPGLEEYVAEKIKCDWSPELIAGRWAKKTGQTLVAESIYKYLYSSFGQRLCKYLKYKRYGKRKRKLRAKRVPASHIPDRISIEKRPSEIAERKTFGHFEADTMGRPKHASQQTLAVMRERLSRKIFGIKVKRLKYTIDGFQKIIKPLPVSSITFDNGLENIRYQELRVTSYFCNPYHSWEKGSVEQGIGQIRSYIPKKADLKHYSQKEIDAIIDTLNNRPMKCLDYQTPNEVFNKNLALYSLTEWCT
jgi:IS30 family transposase